MSRFDRSESSPNRARRPAPAIVFALASACFAGSAFAQTTERISVSSSGAQGDQGAIHWTSITPDGRFVAFQSESTNLVVGDTNVERDIFVRDRVAGTTARVSVSSGGGQSDGQSFHASISADGRYVVFESHAANLVSGDTNGFPDVFLHDRVTGETTRRSVSSSGAQGDRGSYTPVISADGRWIAFISMANTFSPLATNSVLHVYLHERATAATTLISVDYMGGLENGQCFDPSLSADGRYLAFTSTSSDLLPTQTVAFSNVFRWDRVLLAMTEVSVTAAGAEGNGWSQYGAISATGRFVAFQSLSSNLVAGDTNGQTDVFVRDIDAATTERVSVSSTGAESNGTSDATGQPPGISADGRYVAFTSWSTNLVPGSLGWTAIYLRDRALGVTSFASVSSTGAPANNTSLQPSMSSDGRYVVFQSAADNLVPNDTNTTYDIFVRGPLATPWTNLGSGLAGTNGTPNLLGTGTLVAASPGSVELTSARPSAPAILFVSLASTPAKVQCGTLVPLPYALTLPITTDAVGAIPLAWPAWPAALAGQSAWFQYVVSDAAAICGAAFSNALRGDSP